MSLSDDRGLSKRAPADKTLKAGRTALCFIQKNGEHLFALMENIRDWCISRQLWCIFFIVITVEMMVSRVDLSDVQSKKQEIHQDADVDTWFSSWLWPFQPSVVKTRKTSKTRLRFWNLLSDNSPRYRL